ncbi:hypothetical protein [Mycetocola miduiensis]|uniref:Uncharacterized protein n=1 Tax=Mycetocola miduiensis TaxID=995034 RepID=A0A1I5AWV7_9MICO|nr:hypothetical protein [Mycetocola miduiensis]SFN66924.1 hypothetical protein SAMN05216219_1587 [Mycetocola miduiensis]
MSAVDHKAEAIRLDNEAYKTHAGPEVAALYAARAQTHATLFAAEQQRLANLIEWFGDGELSTDPAKREAQLAVQRETEEGLGLS